MGQGQGKAQGEGGEQAIEDSGGRAAVVQEEVDDEADAHNVDTFGGGGNAGTVVAPALKGKDEETFAGGSSAGAGAPLPAFFQGGEGKVAPTAGKEQEQDEWARQQAEFRRVQELQRRRMQEEAAAAAQQAAAQQTEGEEAGGDWQGVEADIEKLTLLDEEAEEDKPSKAPQPPQIMSLAELERQQAPVPPQQQQQQQQQQRPPQQAGPRGPPPPGMGMSPPQQQQQQQQQQQHMRMLPPPGMIPPPGMMPPPHMAGMGMQGGGPFPPPHMMPPPGMMMGGPPFPPHMMGGPPPPHMHMPPPGMRMPMMHHPSMHMPRNMPPPPQGIPFPPPKQGPLPFPPPPDAVFGFRNRPIPAGELMSPREVLYVVQQQLRQLETADPFTDDYYYVMAVAKEAEQRRQQAMMEEEKGQGREGNGDEESKGGKKNRGGVAKLVAPVWQETKDLARRAQAMERQEAERRVAKWEEGNRVLGHTAKSSIARPRELLAIGSSSAREAAAAELAGQKAEGAQAGEGTAEGSTEEEKVLKAHSTVPFAAPLWRVRKAVDGAYSALLALEEAEESLRNPYLAPGKRMEVVGQAAAAKKQLAEALGLLKPRAPSAPQDNDAPATADNKTDLLKSLINNTPAMEEERKVVAAVELDAEGAQLPMLLELAKGQRILARALVALPPQQADRLLAPLLGLLLARPPPPPSTEQGQAEAALFDAMALLVEREEERVGEGIAVAKPSLETHTAVVKLFLAGPLAPSGLTLRSALLSRERAKVLYAVLQRGAESAAGATAGGTTGPQAAEHWNALQGRFMEMVRA